MTAFQLNALPVNLAIDQRVTLAFAPESEMLLAFENKNLTHIASGNYSQGGTRPKSLKLGQGQKTLVTQVINGNGSNLSCGNDSPDADAVIAVGVYGMGESTNGQVEMGSAGLKIEQFQSVAAITIPGKVKFKLTAATAEQSVIYLFSPGKKPQRYSLNDSSSKNEQTNRSRQTVETIGDWQGNMLFFVNLSNAPGCSVNVQLTAIKNNQPS